MDKLILIGGGGHCRSVIDIIEMTKQWEIVGILDKKERLGEHVLNYKYKIIGTDKEISKFIERGYYFLITIGHIKNSSVRKRIFYEIKKYRGKLATVISPLAYVSKYATIGEGSVIMHHALINANAKIGKNCIINTKALVEHDVTIEDHCHISTGAIINGGVVVKEGTFIGSNAVSKQYIVIDKPFIKAGEVIK